MTGRRPGDEAKAASELEKVRDLLPSYFWRKPPKAFAARPVTAGGVGTWRAMDKLNLLYRQRYSRNPAVLPQGQWDDT